MIRHIGYACQNLSIQETIKKKDKVFTDRTLRMDGFSINRAGELAAKNSEDLIKILKWNDDHGVKFFRIGSGMFPFMDHPTLGYRFQDLPSKYSDRISKNMSEAGQFAKQNQMRLSCHPGPYTCIASPDPMIVAKSVISLEMHSLIGDLLGYGDEFAINIHVGGVYEDKHKTAGRFLDVFCGLPDALKKRITLENDDKESMWSMTDLYKMIAKYCTIKLVLDVHHHQFCKKESLLEAADMAFSTWQGFCEIPKVHHSESRDYKRPQAHSNWIINKMPDLSDTVDYDVMFETKMKDKAVLAYPWKGNNVKCMSQQSTVAI
jgi:UV DNA damage endonuclease